MSCPFTVAPMLSPDQSVEVVVGEDLVLNTFLTGFNLPITNIIWTRNGELVSSVTDHITISITGTATPNGTITLTLSPVNASSDGGTYIATATNDAGSIMTVFTVNVTGELTYMYMFKCLTIERLCFIACICFHEKISIPANFLPSKFCQTALFSQQPQL